jgi:hypothetical protein
MFQMVDPVCPVCGSKVSDKVSEFLFSGDELPTLHNISARITGHKCGCGHRFVVVVYDADEPWRANSAEVSVTSDDPHESLGG